MADKKLVEQYYSPPPELGKWEGFRIFMWNSETGQFMGRTGSSWAKILLFYLIFYAILVGFFAAMLAVFYQTLDYKVPKWQMSASLIGSNPGLGFRPMPPESNVESTLVWYKSQDKGSVNFWAQEIDNFLAEYKKPNDKATKVGCSHTSLPKAGEVCDVSLTEQMGQCTAEKSYNYPHSAPCIFLKLNKIYGWVPEVYNETKTTDLPSNMPEQLKKHIVNLDQYDKRRNTIWVTCEGENPADIENIGSIVFYPQNGFPGFYYPFQNQEGYLSPFVAVAFEKPKTGVLINIECKAWAKNIHHDRHDRRGSVHFELMVD